MLVVVLVLARVAWRTFRTYRGTKFSLARTYYYTAIYVAIGAGFSAFSYTEGVPLFLAAPEALLALLAALGSYRYTDRRISFWKASDGQLYFRGGVIIYLIYLAALVIRLGIDLVLVGPVSFTFGNASLAGATLYATMATDLLLVFGVGLLIGRGARVARRFGRITRGEEIIPESPPTPG